MEKPFGKDSETTSRAQSYNYRHANQDDMISYNMLPKLGCPIFQGHHQNKFAFENVLTQFENIVFGVKIDSLKLQILKSYLRGYP